MFVLKCKKLKFYSEHDELSFLKWLKSVPSIKKVEGKGSSLFVYLKDKKISNKDLRELLGIFYRYKINMKQLANFLSSENRTWFFNKRAYWFKRVF